MKKVTESIRHMVFRFYHDTGDVTVIVGNPVIIYIDGIWMDSSVFLKK